MFSADVRTGVGGVKEDILADVWTKWDCKMSQTPKGLHCISSLALTSRIIENGS